MPSDDSLPPPGSPEDWLRYARSDLALAEGPLHEYVLLESLCFHAQQAAEKSIKAVLVWEGNEVRKTHNLSLLLGSVAAALPDDVWSAAGLSAYAVLARYPVDFRDMDESKWRQAVAQARAVVAWASGVIAG